MIERGQAAAAAAAVEALFGALLAAGERRDALRQALSAHAPDTLLAVLRRAVPVRLLELVATQPPWCEEPRLLAAVVLNPRTPRPLALRVLPALYWRDQADVAAGFRLPAALRLRAEALLAERLPELRLGDRITLARLATAPVLRPLLADDARVVRAALLNPRLREDDLVRALEADTASLTLIRGAAESTRWSDSYAVRLALALQARTPLGVALAQLTSLRPLDLLRVAASSGLAPLVQASALRVAQAARTPRP